ncbi:MAG: hypothetical protein AAF488_15120 [Planctomycetota bacterium]
MPDWLVEHLLKGVSYRTRQAEYEPGAAQFDCFDVDPAATRRAYVDVFADRSEKLERERCFLADLEPVGVVADIPALAVRAAGELGIPCVGVANFTWDWILEPIFEGEDRSEIVDRLRDDYARGDLHLKLPFGSPVSPFPKSESAPLVGRTPRLTVEETLGRLGIPFRDRDDRPLVLVCAGGWGANEWPAIRVSGNDHRYLFVGDLKVKTDTDAWSISDNLPAGLDFPDIVQSVDAVMTKPGYGVISECLLAGTPLVSVARQGFRETAPMLDELRDVAPHSHVSREDFFAGRWIDAVNRALESNIPWTDIPKDGARQVARRIGLHFGRELEPSTSDRLGETFQ